MKPVDFRRPDSSERSDGEEWQDAGVCSQEDSPHLLGGEDFDVRFLLLEFFAQLGGGLPVGMDVALLFGETEHGHNVSADAVFADRTEVFQSGEVLIDVGHCDIRDLAIHLGGKLRQITAGGGNIDRTHAPRLKGDDELVCHLGRRAFRESVGPVGGVEPHSIGERHLGSGYSGSRPLLHCRHQRDVKRPHQVLAVLEDFDVAVSRLLASCQSVREANADLLRDQFRLTEISKASCSPPASLVPAHVVLLVAILANERVDLHGGRTFADDHGALRLSTFLGFHFQERRCQRNA